MGLPQKTIEKIGSKIPEWKFPGINIGRIASDRRISRMDIGSKVATTFAKAKRPYRKYLQLQKSALLNAKVPMCVALRVAVYWVGFAINVATRARLHGFDEAFFSGGSFIQHVF